LPVFHGESLPSSQLRGEGNSDFLDHMVSAVPVRVERVGELSEIASRDSNAGCGFQVDGRKTN
jgi:hypothetical protein